jgi:hypothetical protein
VISVMAASKEKKLFRFLIFEKRNTFVSFRQGLKWWSDGVP